MQAVNTNDIAAVEPPSAEMGVGECPMNLDSTAEIPNNGSHDNISNNESEGEMEASSAESLLFEIFERFCKFGIPAAQQSGVPLLDGSRFVKLFKDAGILSGKWPGRRPTTTDCDIVFNTIKRINERKINFDQFAAAIYLFASRIGVEPKEIFQLILSCQGPALVGTTTPTAPVLATHTPRGMSRHSIGSPYKHTPCKQADVLMNMDEKKTSLRQKRYSLKSPSDTRMPEVFERLCNVNTFTGTQKQKMNELRIFRPQQ